MLPLLFIELMFIFSFSYCDYWWVIGKRKWVYLESVNFFPQRNRQGKQKKIRIIPPFPPDSQETVSLSYETVLSFANIFPPRTPLVRSYMLLWICCCHCCCCYQWLTNKRTIFFTLFWGLYHMGVFQDSIFIQPHMNWTLELTFSNATSFVCH